MKAACLLFICLFLLTAGLAVRHTAAQPQRSQAVEQANGSADQLASPLQDAGSGSQIKSDKVEFDFTGVAPDKGNTLGTLEGAVQRDSGLAVAEYESNGTIISKKIAVPLEAPEPFLSVHTSWTSEGDGAGGIKIGVRASTDGRAWGEWQNVVIDHDSPSNGAEHSGSPLYFDQKTKYVQYRISLQRDALGLSPVVKGLRLVFLSPGASEHTPQTRQPQEVAKSEVQSQAYAYSAIPKPAVLARTVWGSPDGESSPKWQPQYTTVTHLIVHHTTSPNSSTDWPAVVRNIWYEHTYLKGWGDIGYNYLIDPNGVIYEGRAGGDNVIGAHFSCANTNTMGIALLGDFSTAAPSAPALKSLKKMLAWKAAQQGIDPEGSAYHPSSQLTLKNISGHRDGNGSPSPTACDKGTVCPGDVLYRLLPTIRHDVRNIVSGACAGTTVSADQWRGAYYSNRYLSGSPAMVSNDGSWFLDFDWGNGNPGDACGIGADNFSVSWTRTLNLNAGLYRFTVTADDGVRLYIDGQLKLDRWVDQAPTTYTVDVPVSAGQHNVRLDYYENGGGAVARLFWEQLSSYNCVASVPSDHWKGEYFNNRYLSGSPAMVRDDAAGFINMDWGTGSPSGACGIGADSFSARWSRNVYFNNSAMYRFTVTADDGVRLYVDGQLKLDRWVDQGPTTYTVDTQLNAGTHVLTLEYYENGGGAVAKLSWAAVASVYAPPIVWEFNTAGNYEGWTPYNASASSVNSGKLFVDPAGVDPFVTGPSISAQASVYKYVQVNIANNGLDDTGAIYFRTQAENFYSEEKKVVFRAANCALCGNAPFYGYTVLMTGNAKWTGTITGLRLDPTGSGQGGTNRDSIGIDYIRLTQSQ